MNERSEKTQIIVAWLLLSKHRWQRFFFLVFVFRLNKPKMNIDGKLCSYENDCIEYGMTGPYRRYWVCRLLADNAGAHTQQKVTSMITTNKNRKQWTNSVLLHMIGRLRTWRSTTTTTIVVWIMQHISYYVVPYEWVIGSCGVAMWVFAALFLSSPPHCLSVLWPQRSRRVCATTAGLLVLWL